MNKIYSVFDILGPVMVGPSSSHTAGAAKLGRIALNIAGGNLRKVTFLLHGSFAETYKGHGTDKALLAGILGMKPDDERLRYSFDIAKEQDLDFEFIKTDLGDVHPNTVRFILEKIDGKQNTVMGSSVGGGNIVINEIDGEEVEFTGIFPAIVTKHYDKPGVINGVTSILSNSGVNIAFMKVFRKTRGDIASMVVETDNIVSTDIINCISKITYIKKVIYVEPV